MVPSITASCLSPEEQKQSQTMEMAPPCFTIDMMFFFLKFWLNAMPDSTGVCLLYFWLLALKALKNVFVNRTNNVN